MGAVARLEELTNKRVVVLDLLRRVVTWDGGLMTRPRSRNNINPVEPSPDFIHLSRHLNLWVQCLSMRANPLNTNHPNQLCPCLPVSKSMQVTLQPHQCCSRGHLFRLSTCLTSSFGTPMGWCGIWACAPMEILSTPDSRNTIP